jgi:hypothetical protein
MNDAMTTPGQCPASAADPAVVKLRKAPQDAPLPDGFDPVAVVRCVMQTREVPGEGQWTFAIAQRATGNLDALVAGLRIPSQTPQSTAPLACDAIGVVIPDFALVDASGDIVRPTLPHDACELPLQSALQALNALSWKTETEQRLSQAQTQPEVDSGCLPTYKDVFKLKIDASSQPWSRVRGTANPRPTEVCVYGVAQTGGSIPEGRFVRGVKLDSSQQAALAAALESAGSAAASPCTATATRLAVLDSAGDFIAFELDGCRRTFFPNDFVGATPGSVNATLTAAGIS